MDAVQIEYSPFDLAIENEAGTNLMATCRELGVAIVAYAPLGRGLLSGTVTSKESISKDGDWRSLFPRFSDDNLDANVDVANQFNAVAKKKGCSAAQLSIAWVLKQGSDVFPIPGTKKVKYLEDNFAASKVRLTDEEDRRIRDIVSRVAGERVQDWAKAQCYVDTVEEA